VNHFRYLNGIDWVITGLDRSLRQAAGCGNWAQLVLELDGLPNAERFRTAARNYASAFPVLLGRSVRGWQLVPVWKFPRRGKNVPVCVEELELPAEVSPERVTEELGRCVCAPPGTPGRYIRFSLLRTGGKSFLAFQFDHRLFDARGAELFFAGLVQYFNSGETRSPSTVNIPAQKACLPPWIPKFKSGRKIVRMLHSQRHEAAPFHLAVSGEPSDLFRFSVICLNKKQSDAVRDRAYAEAGYLMLTPWLADRMTRALDKMLAEQNRPLNGYVIPCSADLREKGEPPVFFNHVAFICLSCPSGSGETDKNRAQHFSGQFVDQVRRNMPGHFENAWKLARILPSGLFGRLLRRELKAFAGTFSMASVGKGLSDIETVDGCPVKNAFHTPMIPPAPGLGFFVNSFRGRLNICLTSTGAVLSRFKHNRLLELLQADFL
jgi:hypothetical protein